MWAAAHAIPFVVLVVGIPWLGSRGLWVGASAAWPLAVLAGAMAIGGAMAGGVGAREGRGRARIAFAVAHVVGLWPVVAVVATLPALGGGETAGQLAPRIVLAFGTAHGIIGLVGALLGGAAGWRDVTAAGAAGIVAGGLGGLVVSAVVPLVAVAGAPEPGVMAAGGLGCATSAAVHGGWWGRR